MDVLLGATLCALSVVFTTGAAREALGAGRFFFTLLATACLFGAIVAVAHLPVPIIR